MRRLVLVIALGVAACNAPENLSSIESEATSLSPTSYNFGSIEVGQTSGPMTFTVSQVGYGSDTVQAVSYSCPDFVINPTPLPYTVYRTCIMQCDPCPTCAQIINCCEAEEDSYSFSAQFRPTVGATVSCAVTLVMSSGTNKTTTLSGTGTLPPIQVSVTPPSVAFGDVRRNTDSSAVTMTVKNAGGQTMTVSSVDIASGYTITSGNMGSHTLGPGASEPYQIVCHPTATGTMGGTFNVHTNDPMTPNKQIPLSCRGIDSALGISPSPTTLATTRVGEPVQTNITLQNTGTASMSLEGVTVTGTDISMVGAAPTGTVNAGASRTVAVAFGATDKGPQAGTLTVTYDGGQTRTSAISANALATSMSITPDGDVQFGPVCAGQTKSQTFSILANEEGSFKVSALSNPGGAFALSSPSLPFTVQGSGANKLMFDVTAMPAEAGEQTATLELTTDIPNAAPRQVNLAVTGIAAGITPNPDQVDFGPNTINTTTIGQSVNLSNCSTSPITFTRPRIEGTDAADFAIVAQPDAATINPTNSASWLIVFQGHTVGGKTASFVVDYDGGTATIPLLGEGIGEGPIDPGDNPIDERSYYTCSSGTGSSFGMLMVVVGLVVWRRRRSRC